MAFLLSLESSSALGVSSRTNLVPITAPILWEAVQFEAVTQGGRTRPLVVRCQRQEQGQDLRVSAVMKAVGNPEITTECLTNELTGYLLAPAFECVVPTPMLIHVSEEFLEANDDTFLGLGFRPEPGLAFGSELVQHFNPVFAHARRQEAHLPAAARAYAFDMAIQNVDRRILKPNCGVQGDQLILFDFEKAFSFKVPGLLGVPAAWRITELAFHREHIFRSWLVQEPINWDHIPGALAEAVELSKDMAQALPDAWRLGLEETTAHLSALLDHAAEFRNELEASLR